MIKFTVTQFQCIWSAIDGVVAGVWSVGPKPVGRKTKNGPARVAVVYDKYVSKSISGGTAIKQFSCKGLPFETQQQYRYFPSISYCYVKFGFLREITGLGQVFCVVVSFKLLFSVRWWQVDRYFDSILNMKSLAKT